MLPDVIPRLALLFALLPLSLRADAPNTLTAAEREAGWRLLFDGRTTEGWRSFRKNTFPSQGWVVTNDTLRHLARGKGGDIITTGTFSSYEFRFEWRMAGPGNSGIKYFITEDRTSAIGHEFQILEPTPKEAADLAPHQRTAGFYDVLPTTTPPRVNPAGEWNSGRIVVRGTRIEHWVNGVQVLQYDLDSDAVRAGIARSKFRDVPGFGTTFPHHLLLQDHGGDIAFRNLKLRPLGR